MAARAHELAAAGVPVLPCGMNTKRPATSRGLKEATANIDQVTAWWHRMPSSNVAVPTGLRETFDVLDVDVRAHGTGTAALSRLVDAGLIVGLHRLVRTPSGGLHLYFAASGQRGGQLSGEHLDFKALGGYVLVPPSRVKMATGSGSYVVLEDRPGETGQLDWVAVKRVLDRDVTRSARKQRPAHRVHPRNAEPAALTAALIAAVASAPEGTRNTTLFQVARRLPLNSVPGLRAELALAAMRSGLSRREAEATVRSAMNYQDRRV